MFDRITDLVTVSGFGSVDQTSFKNYETSVNERKGQVLEIIDPFKEWREIERQRKAKDDARREKLLETLAEKGARGYGSLKEIKESLGMLRKTVKERSADANSNSV